jgi:transposase
MPKKAQSKKTSSPPRAKMTKRAAKPAAKKAAAAKRGKTASKRTGASRAATAESVKQLAEALQAHPRQKDLISAGQEKDQLLRSLIPLYLARSLGVEVTSGTTSRFWSQLGVSYAAPNAAKALRIHTGYASETKKGRMITAKGIRYVEDAINRG